MLFVKNVERFLQLIGPYNIWHVYLSTNFFVRQCAKLSAIMRTYVQEREFQKGWIFVGSLILEYRMFLMYSMFFLQLKL